MEVRRRPRTITFLSVFVLVRVIIAEETGTPDTSRHGTKDGSEPGHYLVHIESSMTFISEEGGQFCLIYSMRETLGGAAGFCVA